jgi:hypothetical protein
MDDNPRWKTIPLGITFHYRVLQDIENIPKKPGRRQR